MTKAPVNLQDLRRRIYRKAKSEPSHRFWGLFVHVTKIETLEEAYRIAKSKGGAPGGETATGLFLDFTFEGDKNASPKYATATVDLTQTGRAGQQVVTHKAFTHFIFGGDGIEHKAIYLESATCMPLAISVHAGRTEKSVKLDFSCTEAHASN